MDTKHKIMDEALTLFAQKGYANVFVGEIAERVGIKAPSLYKHYKSKQAIFDAIIEEMNSRYAQQAGSLNIGIDPASDAKTYKNMSEDSLAKICISMFQYFLHDDYTKRFRKLLTIEQFNNAEFAKIYSGQYIDGPLIFQKMLFGSMVAAGAFVTADVDVMTLQFYAPIYTLLTLCDREPEREKEAIELLDRHSRQFSRIYGGKN